MTALAEGRFDMTIRTGEPSPGPRQNDRSGQRAMRSPTVAETRVVAIPDFCMVVLVGVTSSGKSTFARTHFRPTEVLSTDACRAMVNDDRPAPGIMSDARDVLYFILRKRLARRRLTVVDSTNRHRRDRQRLLAIAREHRAPAVALLFDLPDDLLTQRYAERTHFYVPRTAMEHALIRYVAPTIVRYQKRQLGAAARGLLAEGFDAEYRFTSAADVAAVRIQRHASGDRSA